MNIKIMILSLVFTLNLYSGANCSTHMHKANYYVNIIDANFNKGFVNFKKIKRYTEHVHKHTDAYNLCMTNNYKRANKKAK